MQMNENVNYKQVHIYQLSQLLLCLYYWVYVPNIQSRVRGKTWHIFMHIFEAFLCTKIKKLVHNNIIYISLYFLILNKQSPTYISCTFKLVENLFEKCIIITLYLIIN